MSPSIGRGRSSANDYRGRKRCKKRINPIDDVLQETIDTVTNPETWFEIGWDFVKWIFKTKILRKGK